MNLSEQIEKIKSTRKGEIILVIDNNKERRLARVWSQEGHTVSFQGYLGSNKGMSNPSEKGLSLEKIVEIVSMPVHGIAGQSIYPSYNKTIILDKNTCLYTGIDEIEGFLKTNPATASIIEYIYEYFNRNCYKLPEVEEK